MNLSVGIVGLANVGKSTLFNALLQKQVAFAANFPFATIEPNVGVVPVPDERLPVIAKLVNTTKIVPATVKFVDIAGLVKGAAQGEGLGNKFLAHIREVDLICHVIRTFTDPNVLHVAGEIDFKRDKEIVEVELILADLATLDKTQNSRPQTPGASATGGQAKLKTQNQNVKLKTETKAKLITALNSGRLAKDVELTEQEREAVRELQLLTMKPVLYVLNVGEEDLTNKNVIPDLIGNLSSVDSRLRGNDKKNDLVLISAKIESELAGLSDAEQKEYLQSLGLEKSGLERLIQKAYAKLDLISFLTGGELEARAWTIKRGTKAPQAAGVIHTDFEKGFIKAEVVDFATFVKVGGWVRARELGKVRFEGKEYEMRDGDVVEFKVNA